MIKIDKSAMTDTDKRQIKKKGRILEILYALFTTMITIFPLLGMFGTVAGLLGLDFDDLENIKNNFFVALTSTAWGIIFFGDL